MGGTSYNTTRATTTSASYSAKSYADTFLQTKVGHAHEAMMPKDIMLREARDSEVHPNTVPIIVALDLTGSMLNIPKELISGGLNHMVGSLIESGIPDPAILFLGIGDHECDSDPLQIGQFEGGDEEMNMWLSRVYPEGGGGGNGGESYLLAWQFAGGFTQHDAMDKRGEKGILITIGDEPTLRNLPQSYLANINKGGGQSDVSAEQALAAAQELYDVHHIHVKHSPGRITNMHHFLSADNYHEVDSSNAIPSKITEIVVNNTKTSQTTKAKPDTISDKPSSKPDIL